VTAHPPLSRAMQTCQSSGERASLQST
jgi:hypothetical protein